MKANILPQNFYNRKPEIVAKKLLGKYLVRNLGDSQLVGKIIETEAYPGLTDPASHSFKGKTKRNELLFGEAGNTYIHSIHKYFCMDIVTEEINVPSSVLIRALAPIKNLDGFKLDGPGKICMALQINKVHNGADITNPDSPIYITEGERVEEEDIVMSPRVGISKARGLMLRFRLK